MTITKMANGLIAFDWGPGGPYITLTARQWAELKAEMRKL